MSSCFGGRVYTSSHVQQEGCCAIVFAVNGDLQRDKVGRPSLEIWVGSGLIYEPFNRQAPIITRSKMQARAG